MHVHYCITEYHHMSALASANVCSRCAGVCSFSSGGMDCAVYIYIYAFSRRFYPKLHIYCQCMCSLGIEPTTFALLTQCSTTEPQEHMLFHVIVLKLVSDSLYLSFSIIDCVGRLYRMFKSKREDSTLTIDAHFLFSTSR